MLQQLALCCNIIGLSGKTVSRPVPSVAQFPKSGHFCSRGKGDTTITTQALRLGSRAFAPAALICAGVAVMLMTPALWNGYPLLQYDTGGYLARWYEGYLVPSRSTTFGIYLHLGETSRFWINLLLQSVTTVWVVMLTLRAFGLFETWSDVRRFALLMAVLCIATALPWLVSLLLTDIFAGLSVLTLYLLICRDDALSRTERAGLFAMTAFAVASHSATMAATTSGLVVLAYSGPL